MAPPPTPSAAELKERERATWENAAPGWRTFDRHIVEFSQPVTEAMIRKAQLLPGARVLDLASGTGEPSLSIAERVGPTGSVQGFDLAEPMLEFAREKAKRRGLRNVEYRTGDAELLELPAAGFDAATMRYGIMFLPDPVAALRRVHAALKPGGRVVLATWGPPGQNPFLYLPIEILQRFTEVPVPPPGSPGIFAFGDRERLRSVLKSAGFSDVATAPVPLVVTDFATGADYWNFEKAIAGPIMRLFETVPEPRRKEAEAQIRAAAERFQGPHGLEIPALVWLGWGTR